MNCFVRTLKPLLVPGLLLGGLLTAPAANGALTSEEKMDHFTEALAARDAGEYYIARQKLEILAREYPLDSLVESTLREVNERITASQEAGRTGVTAAPSEADSEIDSLMRDEMDRQTQALNRAERAVLESERMIRSGDYGRALGVIYSALRTLPDNVTTQSVRHRLNRKKADALFAQASALLNSGNKQAAWESLAALAVLEGNSTRFQQLKTAFDNDRPLDPSVLSAPPADVSAAPGNTQSSPTVAHRGTPAVPASSSRDEFFEIVGVDPGARSRRDLRGDMISEVEKSWSRPQVLVQSSSALAQEADPVVMLQKLNSIIIPSVSYGEMELSRVVNSLNELSLRFDTGLEEKAVNIVLIDPNKVDPKINITLRNLSLKRVLDFVVDSVGFQYDVEVDAVVIRPGEGGAASNLETEFFPISRSTFIRMTGIGVGEDVGVDVDDPFLPVSPGIPDGGVDEAGALQNFLQQAGVDFVGNPGSSLAYDGSSMIVTQTKRNLDRIRNILNRYDEVRQVEIEAKFLEVAQGDLNELGFDWTLTRRNQTYTSSNRSVTGSFNRGSSDSNIIIDGQAVDTLYPPQIPGENAFAAASGPLGVVTNALGNFDVVGMLRALSQKSGSDLLSAPKVTVLSGDLATITVAQELRYPESYSDIEPEVGSGSSLTGGSSGSAGVIIAAGTPQDFTVRNVGVELSVTPRVEEDDYSITLDLYPKVTEFDGFVEYGGPSIAISSGRQVSVPSGFYQPIFSVREVKTRVTIWDGATLVMGGLTREEVREIDDKVPFFGDLPLIGRVFRSKGETMQKRNLLIFVTANMVSPGGSFKNQRAGTVQPNSTFQNPSVSTPGGLEFRNP